MLRRRGRPHPRAGNYATLFALMLPVVFGVLALSVDLSYIQLVELQGQYAADAASHAAFVTYRTDGDTERGTLAAEYLLSRNLVGGEPADIDQIDFGSWDGRGFRTGRAANSARIRVSRADGHAIPLFFGPLVGYAEHQLGAGSTTAGRNRQIMIVQDITGSFRDDIDNARVADLAFLESMLDAPYPEDIGMSTFVGGVESDTWSPLLATSAYGDSIRAQWQTLDWCNCEAGAMEDEYGRSTRYRWYHDCRRRRRSCPIPSWEDYCEVEYGGHDTRSSMVDCWSVGTNTAPGPGLDQAVDELLDYGTTGSFQAIVLISDGLPCCGSQTSPRRLAAMQAADRAWDHEIHIWSVAFNNGGGDYRFLADLTRGMGRAYETPDSADLEEILLEIAASIPVVTVE